jgi:hypothetical protein
MYGAPIPDLPSLLAEGAGQGLLICGALQDLSQAVARWGDVGHGFLTFWQNTLVLPGIRDDRTLELLSKLTGEYEDTSMWTESWNQQQSNLPGGGFVWVRSHQQHAARWRHITFDEMATGNPLDPSEVIHFGPTGYGKVKLMKYWTGQPWPAILLQSSEWALRGANDEAKWGKYAENWALPLPNLMAGGNPKALFETGGQHLVNWYWAVKQDWESKQRRDPEDVSSSSYA